MAAKIARKETKKALAKALRPNPFVSSESLSWYLDFSDLEKHRADVEGAQNRLASSGGTVITSDHLLLNRGQ